MRILSTGVTRRILNFVIGLHRRAVLSECEALTRRADDLFAAADRQKKVIAAEYERLEALQLAAVKAEQEADAAWQEADAAWQASDFELAQYPLRP